MLSLQAVVLLAASLTGETALIDFSADWCGPCRQMDPTVARLSALGYPVRKVNIDREKALASQFQVRSIPCFVLVVDGKEIDRVVGATSFERLHEMLSRHAVPKGSDVNQARGQSPDRAPGRNATYGLASIDKPAPRPVAATPRSAAPRSADPDLGARLLAASVRLKINDPNGHSFGSGTIIETSGGEALILTCGHIFRDSQGRGRISVDLFGPGAPQGIQGQLVGYDLKSDVGLVSFRPGCPVQAAEVADQHHPVRRGDKVINIGCNNGGEPTLRASHVASLDKFLGPPNVQVAGQPVQGRSGGGLFTADGQVIGVCNAADPADDEGLYAALPSIWAQLHRHVGPQFAQRSQPEGRSIPGERQLATIPGKKLPAMPERMPLSNVASQPVPQPLPVADERDPRAAVATRTLSREERSTLAELQRRDPQAEVICIVRSPNARNESEIVVLDRASQEFLSKLAAERSGQGSPFTNASNQRLVADARWPATGGQAAAASGAGAGQPRPIAVSPDLLQPATHSRSQPNGWKPQWMKPN